MWIILSVGTQATVSGYRGLNLFVVLSPVLLAHLVTLFSRIRIYGLNPLEENMWTVIFSRDILMDRVGELLLTWE